MTSMTFKELAWGSSLYWLVTDYDSSYRKLFIQETLLAKLRQGTGAVSPEEFKVSVMTFLNVWGGRHIRKDAEVAGVLLEGLNLLHDKFQLLGRDTLLTTNFDNREKLVQEIFDSLRSISWENRGLSRNVTVHLGETFASKLAHVMNPSLFVMWDNGIAVRTWQRRRIKSLWDYVGFLKVMQTEAKSVTSDFKASLGGDDPALFLSSKFGYTPAKTLAKYLDEYNWVCSQRNIDRVTPPDWLLRL
jgi:hypothetical protein